MKTKELLFGIILISYLNVNAQIADVGTKFHKFSLYFNFAASQPLNSKDVLNQKNANFYAEPTFLLKYRTGYKTSVYSGVRYNGISVTPTDGYSWSSIEIPLSFGYVFKQFDSKTFDKKGKRSKDVYGLKINLGLNYNISELIFDKAKRADLIIPDMKLNNNLSGFTRLSITMNGVDIFVKYTTDITPFGKDVINDWKREYLTFGGDIKIVGW